MSKNSSITTITNKTITIIILNGKNHWSLLMV